MSRGVIVFGASGSGTTTIGKAVTDRMGWRHFDLDDYFWTWDTPIPYTVPRPKPDRIALLQSDLEGCPYFVLSGSMCGWDGPFVPLLDLAVFVQTATDVRMERLRRRERCKFDSRIEQGGDMYKDHMEFLAWAASYDHGDLTQRSLHTHREWAKGLPCPVIILDGAQPVPDNASAVINKLRTR